MAKYDPFQQNFTTVDELFANPRGGLRSNPSKAYDTIVKAVKDSGGWIQKRDQRYFYGVLAGPMTGTYVLGARYNSYAPRFDFGVNPEPMTLGLYKFQFNRLMEKIRPMYEAVKQAQVAAGIEVTERTAAGRARTIERVREDLLSDVETAQYDEPGMVASLERKLALFEKDPYGYTNQLMEGMKLSDMKNSEAFRSAEKLYLMSQAGGIPVERVIADLKEKPKRLLSLADVRIPTRLSDRTRYSNEFLRTWSPGKAFKRLIPNVEGEVPAAEHRGERYAEEVRGLLSGVPSWRQMAQAYETPDDVRREEWATGRTLTEKQVKELRTTAWVRRALAIKGRFETSGVTNKVFREQLLRRYSLDDLSRLADTVRGIQAVGPLLAENDEGRNILHAWAQRDWPTILRAHDRVMDLEGRNRGLRPAETKEQLERAEKFKRGAEQFALLPGVKPLIKPEEYKCEGGEMGHCVYSRGYYMSEAGYEFAFKAEDGTRATLELGKDGTVMQFFGPGNSPPSAATKQMLNQFMAVNADNIEKMRKGEFPVYAKSNRGSRHRGRA